MSSPQETPVYVPNVSTPMSCGSRRNTLGDIEKLAQQASRDDLRKCYLDTYDDLIKSNVENRMLRQRLENERFERTHTSPHSTATVTEGANQFKSMPAKYDGSGDWDDYFHQFSCVARYHNWDQMTKFVMLTGRLKDRALAVTSSVFMEILMS